MNSLTRFIAQTDNSKKTNEKLNKILIINYGDEYHANIKLLCLLKDMIEWEKNNYLDNSEISIISQSITKNIFSLFKTYYLSSEMIKEKCLIRENNIFMHNSNIDKEINYDLFDDIQIYNTFGFIIKKGERFKKYLDLINKKNLGEAYERDIELMRKNISLLDNLIRPTFNTTINIKNIFSEIFAKTQSTKTYIIITRNYKTKQSSTNTIYHLPNLSEILEYLAINEIKVINIGFPPQKYNINNKNYHEINTNLTQEELISCFYLSDGILISGLNGGFISHIFSLIDVFLIYPEWGNMQLCENRAKINEVTTQNISDLFRDNDKTSILKILKNHKKKSPLLYADEEKNLKIKDILL